MKEDNASTTLLFEEINEVNQNCLAEFLKLNPPYLIVLFFRLRNKCLKTYMTTVNNNYLTPFENDNLVD